MRKGSAITRWRRLRLEPLEQRTLLSADYPWHNENNALDVDGDQKVAPIDTVLILNYLNSRQAGPGPVPTDALENPPYYDVDGDNYVTAGDSLTVLNALNSGIQLGSVTPGAVVTIGLTGMTLDTSATTTVKITDAAGNTYLLAADAVGNSTVTFPVPWYLNPTTGRVGSGIVYVDVEQRLSTGTVTKPAGRMQIQDLAPVSAPTGKITQAFFDASQFFMDQLVTDYQALATAGGSIGNLSDQSLQLQVVQQQLTFLRNSLAPLFNGAVNSIAIGPHVALDANSLSLLDRELMAMFPTASISGADQVTRFRNLLDTIAAANGQGLVKMQDAVSIALVAGNATNNILVGNDALLAGGGGTTAAAEIGHDIAILVAASAVAAKHLQATIAAGDATGAAAAAEFGKMLLDPGKTGIFDAMFSAFADFGLPISQSAALLVSKIDTADEFFTLSFGADHLTNAERVAASADLIHSNLP